VGGVSRLTNLTLGWLVPTFAVVIFGDGLAKKRADPRFYMATRDEQDDRVGCVQFFVTLLLESLVELSPSLVDGKVVSINQNDELRLCSRFLTLAAGAQLARKFP
jgi:hypothetical protein